MRINNYLAYYLTLTFKLDIPKRSDISKCTLKTEIKSEKTACNQRISYIFDRLLKISFG